MRVVQIVRRFGRVGGMESYVWELTRELVSLGTEVVVICERQFTPIDSRVRIIEVGEVCPKPRWFALLRFSNKVKHIVRESGLDGWIIHSHERTGLHDITTFHGPPFAEIKESSAWRKVSVRVLAYLWMEKRELCGSKHPVVVPNSFLIRSMLDRYYPCIGRQLTHPILPGVSPIKPRPKTIVDPLGGVIGFVGKEWKRKGLVRALEIVTLLAKKRPNLKFVIVGPDRDEVLSLLHNVSVQSHVMGWAENSGLYQGFDMLLHPAEREPYGMVVAEAWSAGVPVMLSDRCGISSELVEPMGFVISLDAPSIFWAEAADDLLRRMPLYFSYSRPWREVAHEYRVEYKKIQDGD